jgi:hypothetical protein
MEDIKELVQDLRSHLALVNDKIKTLADLEVTISIEIGTNVKTVNFENISFLECEVKARIAQDL